MALEEILTCNVITLTAGRLISDASDRSGMCLRAILAIGPKSPYLRGVVQTACGLELIHAAASRSDVSSMPSDSGEGQSMLNNW